MDKDNGGNQGFDSIQEASEEEEGGRGWLQHKLTKNKPTTKFLIVTLFIMYRCLW